MYNTLIKNMLTFNGPSIDKINVTEFTVDKGQFKSAQVYWDDPRVKLLCIFKDVTFPYGIRKVHERNVLPIIVDEEIVKHLNELRTTVEAKANYSQQVDRKFFPLDSNIFTVKCYNPKIFKDEKESVTHIPAGTKGTAYVILQSLWLNGNMTGFKFVLDSVYF